MNESIQRNKKQSIITAEALRRFLLGEADTSQYIAMSRPWLRLQRMRGTGPAFLRIGRSIRYDVRDLDTWLSSHRVECQ
jgi:hypothetical protein